MPWKHQALCYRTINGVRWPNYGDFVPPERILKYRTHGILCRKIGPSLFMHPVGVKLAQVLDNRDHWTG